MNYRTFSQEKILDAVCSYHNYRFNVIPLRGKKPALRSWARLMNERVQGTWIKAWSNAQLFENVGIVCGKISGNLVVVDLDGLEAVERYHNLFPDLCETLTIRTGSGKGQHLYYFDTDTSTVRMKGFEVRGDGCYVVAPPSIHPDSGKPYRVSKNAPILKTDLKTIREWIESQRQPKRTIPQSGKRERTIGGDWANRALTYECSDVASAAPGERNNRLNIAAYNIGQIVGDGLLSRAYVEPALLAAALSSGISEKEALATIASGLNAGIANPRSHQWQKR